MAQFQPALRSDIEPSHLRRDRIALSARIDRCDGNTALFDGFASKQAEIFTVAIGNELNADR